MITGLLRIINVLYHKKVNTVLIRPTGFPFSSLKKLRFRRREAILLWLREIGELLLVKPIPRQYPGGKFWQNVFKALLPDPLAARSLEATLWRLKQEGFVKSTGKRGDIRFQLSEKGENYAASVAEYLEEQPAV